MNKTMAILCMVGMSMPFMAVASGETFHWKDNAQSTSWTNKENYVENAVPSANDIVVVGNATVYLSDSDMDSFNLASSLDRIAPSNNNSKVVFTIDGTDEPLVFGAGISKDATFNSKIGTIEKNGRGTVKFTKNSGGTYDFQVAEFNVVEGMVDFSSRTRQEYFMRVYINEGATFKIPSQTTWVTDLKGGGTVAASSDYALRVYSGTAEEPIIVEPKLTSVNFNCPGYTRILRTDNTMRAFSVYDGVTEIIDIGSKNQPSPTGYNESIYYSTDGYGGTIRYIGESDTQTDKAVYIANNNSSAHGKGLFDAGPHGGVTFNGNWGWTTKSYGRPHLLGCFTLTGTNQVPCRINGKIGFSADTTNGRLGDLGIIKRGSGAWHLANKENYFASALYVDEGELGFDSIKEKGEVCALGKATDLKDVSKPGNYSNATDVAYAIRLGSQTKSYPSDGLATLRYFAATNASCTTRPIALAGDARIVSDSHKLVLRGVSSCSEGVNRLVLAGDAVGVTNIMHDVTDGTNATMRTGVVKEGSGTWILTGTNSFSGPLVVNGGKLVLKRPSDQYTWYRLVIKDTHYIDGVHDGFKIGRIGLFDKDGYRQNIGLECLVTELPQNAGAVLDEQIPSFLEPGQYGWGMSKRYYWWISNETTPGRGLSALCRTGECYDQSCIYMTRSGITAHYIDDPDKYLFIDMRLTNGVPEIGYYDIAAVHKKDSDYWKLNIKAWSLLGSTDGIRWDELHSVDDSMSDDPDQKMKIPSTANCWMAQNARTSGNTAATKHNTEKLQPIASKRAATNIPFMDRVETVTVANGAVLEADGDITLSKFKVAANATAGTVKGFKLAPNCTIDVSGIPAETRVLDLPLLFDGVSPSGAEWTLTVNGGDPTNRYRLDVVGDRLRLVAKGMLIVIF